MLIMSIQPACIATVPGASHYCLASESLENVSLLLRVMSVMIGPNHEIERHSEPGPVLFRRAQLHYLRSPEDAAVSVQRSLQCVVLALCRCSFTHKHMLVKVVTSLISRLEDSQTSWDVTSLSGMLHEENAKASLKQKEYMTILRHALTGMKVRRMHLSSSLFCPHRSACRPVQVSRRRCTF